MIYIITYLLFLLTFIVSWHFESVRFNDRLHERRILYELTPEIEFYFKVARDYAYKKVFREDVIVYKTSKVPLDENNIQELKHKYTKLVFVYTGNKIMEDIINVYGDKETVINFIVNEFIDRLGHDEMAFTDMIYDQTT